MELYAFNPGPLDGSVLYDQEKHVSSAVWEGQERGALRCHEHTSKLDQWTLTPVQIELIEKAGFGYLRFIPAISLDNPLISALVERWRRETNTFHFNVGEMTVTLEDVAYLLGLAIDGEPVIGVTYTNCEAVCMKLLGKSPGSGYTSGGMVKLSWLKDCFSSCPRNASKEDIEHHTRAYLLYLVGSTIFSTTTGNKVPVMYLPLFEDFQQCGKYAWGAAALAFLYRALGNASLRSQSTVSGSLTLLQCWSYYHLNIGRPKLTGDAHHDQFPLVIKWKGKQSGPTANRDITFYRKALDSLKPSDVEWNPYRNVNSKLVPGDIARSLIMGRSKTMLICFDKAEKHLPDHCLRQYGFRQPIPPPIMRWERKSRGVDGGVDLSGKMESELREWSERYLHIIEKNELVDDSDYMQWYLRITRRFVGRPIPLASEFQRMNSTLREVAHIADTFSLQGLDNEQIQSITRIRYIIHECLRDQAGSVVTVAMTTSEDEDGKRGRGKEKVRRKSVVKRRRKDDVEQQFPGDNRGDELLPNPSAAEIDYVQIPQIEYVQIPQIEYVQIPHPSEVVDHQQSTEVGFAQFGQTTNTVLHDQIDHPQFFPTVSEIDDAQLCMSLSKGDDEPGACPSNKDHVNSTSGIADYKDSLLPPNQGYGVDDFRSSSEVNRVDDFRSSSEVNRVDDFRSSSEVNRVDDSQPSHAVSENDDHSPSQMTMLSVSQSTHRSNGDIAA